MTQQISPALQQRIDREIAALHRVAAHLPGVLIVHSARGLGVEYMSETGLSYLNTTVAQIRAMGMDYYSYYFNGDDAGDYISKIETMISRNSFDEQVSFFQQVRRFPGDEWRWFFSTTRLFLQDEVGEPLLAITTSLPVDPRQHVTPRINRLLEETSFVRTHQQLFETLTEREREVLRLLAMSCSAAEIAAQLVISVHTVETHRKNLRKKLRIGTAYELNRFASAFNLI